MFRASGPRAAGGDADLQAGLARGVPAEKTRSRESAASARPTRAPPTEEDAAYAVAIQVADYGKIEVVKGIEIIHHR